MSAEIVRRFVVFGLAFMAATALAQEKKSLSYQLPQGAIQYTKEHVIDVGDVPGHQVRAFELRIDYSNVPLSFEGVKAKEGWTRGVSDYTNGSGTASNYGIIFLENGNTLYTKDSAVGHAVTNADGSRVLKYSIVSTFMGGTGNFKGIRGQLRQNGQRVPGTNSGHIEVSGEYWIEK